MYIKHIVGKEGEEIALQYLIKNGYMIIKRNFRCRQGEIDIIAKNKDEFVFIEVKTRTNMSYGSPIDSITYYKKKRILKTIKYYSYLNRLENSFIRIDAIQIYIKNNKIYLSHIKGVI